MERETMEREKKWYIIHTYSGYERKVAESLMNRIQAYDLGECIGQILIPTEDVVEMKSGKKIVTTKLTFPGYILVEMDMTDKAWHVVRGRIPRSRQPRSKRPMSASPMPRSSFALRRAFTSGGAGVGTD